MTAKYEQIYNKLKDDILSGKTPAGTRLPGCRELATRLGASYVTVTNAVRKLAADGFVESNRGSGIVVLEHCPRGAASAQVALTVPTEGDLFQNFFSAVLREAGKINMLAIPVTTNSFLSEMEFGEQRRVLARCAAPEFDGWIINGPREFPFRALPDATGKTLTFVLQCDCETLPPGANRILPDYREAGRLGARHLLQNDIEKLLFLTFEEQPEIRRRACGSRRAAYDMELLDGAEEVMREAGMDFAANCVILRSHCNKPLQHTAELEQYLRRYRCGILAVGDARARQVYLAAAGNGLTVGRDLFLCGLFNTSWAEVLTPNLTSISVKEEKIGRLAIQSVQQKMRGKVIIIKPELILRES